MVNTYENDRLEETTTRLFKVANIVGDSYKRNMENNFYLRNMVRNYGDQANSRILIIDENRMVLFDNYNSIIGDRLNNEEIRKGLRGIASSHVYTLNDEEVLQLAVPISYSNGYEESIMATVLISHSLKDLYTSLGELKATMLRISYLSIFGALFLTAISSTTITRSLRKLTIGVEKIVSGQLGYKVDVEDKGEVGNLVNTFNHMSERLHNIESNRKSFINSISHELRTPITSIKALIDSLLLGDNSKETYDEFLKDIRSETLRMEELVNYLMGSIKLEDISLDLKEENLSQIINESVSLITPYANKYGVKIKMDVDDNIIVKCDKNRTKEIMLNLLENAIKYRDDSKNNSYILVRLKCDRKQFSLEVEDNGKGISKELGEKIFDRGFRVVSQDTLSKQKTEGYGIGLALVKNIVDKHKWNISFNSEVGLGTVFYIDGNIH